MVAPPTPAMSSEAPARAALRTDLRALRKAHCAESKPEIRVHDGLIERLRTARCVGGYCATRFEADPLPILRWCASQGIATALPCLDTRDALMVFRHWAPGEPLETSAFAFNQPLRDAQSAMPDLLLIPLLGFDSEGNRLGQGAGHYDRYLEAHPTCLRIGLGWSWQQVDAIPAESWDVPLQAMVTERQFVNFFHAKD